MYEYKVNVVKVVDGDTVDVDIDLGFGTWILNERVRLSGIDAPAARTTDSIEKLFGIAAKERLTKLLAESNYIRLHSKGFNGKYGRILGDLEILDDYNLYTTVTEVLIREGHCVPYFGGSKVDTQSVHAENRRRLVAEGVVILPDEFKGLL